MIVALSKKCLFIHVPKTAGVSVRYWLSRVANDDTVLSWDHATIMQWKAMLRPEAFSNFFKFAFVRNPWDRLVSNYSWCLANHVPFVEGKSFDEYVRLPNLLDYFPSQSHWLMNEKREYLVDFIGRFENIEEDIVELARRLDVPVVPLERRNGSCHHDYRLYYTRRTKELVRQIYSEDINRFEYQFGAGVWRG